MSVEITLASAEQLKEVADLAHQIWHQYYPDIIGIRQVDYMLNKFYHLDALIEQTKEGQEFYIIQNNSHNIGFVSVSKKEENGLFINKLYVKESDKNKGIGSYVIHWLIQKYSPHHLKLTVNRQNIKAINFYFKNGFKIQEIADFDIGNGYVMNDFIMVKHI